MILYYGSILVLLIALIRFLHSIIFEYKNFEPNIDWEGYSEFEGVDAPNLNNCASWERDDYSKRWYERKRKYEENKIKELEYVQNKKIRYYMKKELKRLKKIQ